MLEVDGPVGAHRLVELCWHFPGITDNTRARVCVRTIAGWRPRPMPMKDLKGVRALPWPRLAGLSADRCHHRVVQVGVVLS
jgi:hypothetical protein